METKLKINEIFYSIQGESTYAGKPCIFIRLTYCNLRCSNCDTEYAFNEGTDMSISEILSKIKKYPCTLVEVTGGEPLFQNNCIQLLQSLILNRYKVMLETGGSLPLHHVPAEVIKIVDFKCPSSKMEKKNDWSILADLNKNDEVKFVIGDKEDFDWAVEKIVFYQLTEKFTVLFSPVFNRLKYETLAEWILYCNLPIRFQAQIHKHIWNPNKKGV
jgi:7-carboxy-7-deazaguanine synthase